MRFPLLVRLATIAAVAIAVLLPIHLIRGKVAERQANAEAVMQQFAAETSREQVIVGPFLAITCQQTYAEERQVMRAGKAETIRETKTGACPTAHFSPREFRADATLPIESLHRGIYPIRHYRAIAKWSGEFEWPGPAESTPTHQRAWKQAYLVTHIRDPRGVKRLVTSSSAPLLAGLGEPGIEPFTVREYLGPYEAKLAATRIAFRYEAIITGTGSFEIAPVGDRNEIRLASSWPHPSFSRAWSPDERTVSAQGFTATWRVDSVATGGNATWRQLAAPERIAGAQGAGVAIVEPVNVYSLSYRATEYAFLFLLFTFAALAVTETVAGIRLHPVQYGLVGCALAIFFLLLLALSEHLPFATSYASAATACVLLITFYLRQPLRSAARAAAFPGILGTMYATLYVMLQSEDSALLMGSLLVFAVLAVVMIATRRIDWTALGRRLAAPAQA